MVGNVYPLGKFLLTFVFLLCGNILWADAMIIDDMRNSSAHGKAEEENFCEEKSDKWCFVSDKVMGGVSEGSFQTIVEGNDAHYNMQGNVSTKNNGGFLQFRTKISNHPKNKLYKGIRIQVRGNNEEYAVHIRTKYLLLPWQYYQSTFIATNEWQVIELPLKNFIKSNFYQPSKFGPSEIKSIGFVAFGKDFEPKLDIIEAELF